MRAIVIGAGPGGLAIGACLKTAGAVVQILDRADTVASSWRRHYDALKLHTVRSRSSLPFLAMPKTAGRYPTRDEVVAYLDAYAAHLDLAPQFGCAVTSVTHDGVGWVVTHSGGEDRADVVVFATGLADQPRSPDWTDPFDGQLLHASAYKSATPFRNDRVLVVGFGNSAGDIAVDLARAGAEVSLSVRGPVNILPKELFGIPITSFGIVSKVLGARVADALTAPVLRAKIGRPADYGLQAAAKGPVRQVVEDGKIPLIDMGLLAALRDKQVGLRPEVDRLMAMGAQFTDGSIASFDTIIAATGYKVDLRPILGAGLAALDTAGKPKVSGAKQPVRNLYFCSYHASSNGQLNQIGKEARAITAELTHRFALSQTSLRA